MKRTAALLCLLCACCLGAEVKTYHLKDGRQIVGRQVGKIGDRVMIKGFEGTRHVVKKADIVRAEAKETTGAERDGVVCDRFKLVKRVNGDRLHLCLDTDLPDATDLMVAVSRSYWEKGGSSEYPMDYFSQKSTVGEWRSERLISLDSSKWKSALKEQQEKMAKLGMPFDVARISKEIEVSMVVPINQANPRFGERNCKLSGKTVSKKGLRVIRAENRIRYPLDSAPIGRSPFPSLHPRKLEVGMAYMISDKLVVCPHHSPRDVTEAFKQVRHVPSGHVLVILDVFNKNGTPWYQVIASAPGAPMKDAVTGWVNSHALARQKLSAKPGWKRLKQ